MPKPTLVATNVDPADRNGSQVAQLIWSGRAVSATLAA